MGLDHELSLDHLPHLHLHEGWRKSIDYFEVLNAGIGLPGYPDFSSPHTSFVGVTKGQQR